MSDKPNTPPLETLFVLSRISQLLESKGEMTKTSLIRNHEISEKLFDEAVRHGHAIGCLAWGERNKFSLKKKFAVPEKAYYESSMSMISALWNSEKSEYTDYYIEDTSSKDSKIVGQWTRPDFTLISQKKFSWTIGTEFDVVTFEVKKPETANVLGVFEALAHATCATRSYVVFPLDREHWLREEEAQARRVEDECIRHGIGLIFTDPSGNGKAVHALKAPRKEIDHEKCNDFLKAVMSHTGKDRIAAWKS
jgi:hypothetical protein